MPIIIHLIHTHENTIHLILKKYKNKALTFTLLTPHHLTVFHFKICNTNPRKVNHQRRVGEYFHLISHFLMGKIVHFTEHPTTDEASY